MSKELIIGLAGDEISSQDSLVLGIICIDHCQGDINRLTYQVVVDCWMALTAAKYFNTSCFIVIADYEEILCNPNGNSAAWQNVGDYMEKLTTKLASQIGVNTIIGRTTNEKFYEHVMRASLFYKPFLTEDILSNLYYVNYFNKPDKTPSYRFLSTRHNLLFWMPDLVADFLSLNTKNFVVSANLQQIRAFSRTQSIFTKSNPESNVKMSQIVFAPAVSLTAKARMSRSQTNEHKLFLSDSLTEMREKIQKTSPIALKYWNRVIPSSMYSETDELAVSLHGLIGAI